MPTGSSWSCVGAGDRAVDVGELAAAGLFPRPDFRRHVFGHRWFLCLSSSRRQLGTRRRRFPVSALCLARADREEARKRAVPVADLMSSTTGERSVCGSASASSAFAAVRRSRPRGFARGFLRLWRRGLRRRFWPASRAVRACARLLDGSGFARRASPATRDLVADQLLDPADRLAILARRERDRDARSSRRGRCGRCGGYNRRAATERQS